MDYFPYLSLFCSDCLELYLVFINELGYLLVFVTKNGNFFIFKPLYFAIMISSYICLLCCLLPQLFIFFSNQFIFFLAFLFEVLSLFFNKLYLLVYFLIIFIILNVKACVKFFNCFLLLFLSLFYSIFQFINFPSHFKHIFILLSVFLKHLLTTLLNFFNLRLVFFYFSLQFVDGLHHCVIVFSFNEDWLL